MELQDLRNLLDYHYWARDRLLQAVEPLTPEQYTQELGNSFRSVRDTLTHIYFAEWAWHLRWRGESPAAPLPPDTFPDFASLKRGWAEHEAKVRTYLDDQGEAGVHRIIEYKLLNGQPGSSVFSHLLQHLVNHASYHRGQVTTLLRQLGAAPPKSMDMVAYYRERIA